MYISKIVSELIIKAKDLAHQYKHEYLTPEHLLVIMCEINSFRKAFEACSGDVQVLKDNLKNYLEDNLEKREDIEPIESFSLQQAFIRASEQVINSGKDEIGLDHILAGIMVLPESYGVYYVLEQGVTLRDLLFELCHTSDAQISEESSQDVEQLTEENEETIEEKGLEGIGKYITHLNKVVEKNNAPLIGREDILMRTIQVLCRKNKNNPIHVGEPGVGKTAITMGIAKLLNEDKVPEVLRGAQIFSLDLGATLAGTQYRGDFEKRLKKILDVLKKQYKPIIYIDEIHNIVGAGSLGAGSLDASNLLKPYLTEGSIKFIGATTFEEYKKYVEKDKGLVRRFQTIEVQEPSIEETIEILQGVKEGYEAYHGVTYTDEAIRGAAQLSEQYINDRFLPDKAIDLLDEAGAYYTLRNKLGKDSKRKPIIDLSIIEHTLSKICHIPKQKIEKNEIQILGQLEQKLKKQVFGQDKAIEQVVTSIKLSRAGLGDHNKPTASLLFVGPTGVGKTEIAKCLAEELGIKLIRFDMSEYTEKHTASKLIGSPPGYIGYEEGGLLTDAIRKTPYCVLLLDEIEKAHQDIYNILLQVMDYATLTDNKGRKADFQNVILIMTSNAGASKIGKSLVGFGERKVQGEAINDEVKKVFSPEFRNRLTATVVFNHITKEMATLIIKKELNKLKTVLKEKGVNVTFNKKCIDYILDRGISAEYGAREISRLIETKIKPVLAQEILFGKLDKDKTWKINLSEGEFNIKVD